MTFKNTLDTLLICFLFCACISDDDNNQNNNPNIPNIAFDTGNQININLGGPYGQLEFVNNPIKIPNYGVNGIVVVNTGFNSYSAFEFSDPNHPISSCSIFNADPGIVAVTTDLVCSCDDGNVYNVLSGGLPSSGTTGQFTLVRYRVEVIGSVIRVFNN